MIHPPLTIIVMAKRARPGRVKTRLIGDLSPEQAAQTHQAMLQCVLTRITTNLAEPHRANKILALDDEADATTDPAPLPPAAGSWQHVSQGSGDLGQRMLNASEPYIKGPIVFFGSDTPDIPSQILNDIPHSLEHSDAAVGPTSDGGYWCLAMKILNSALAAEIDWGTPAVYNQTVDTAERHQIKIERLPLWYDVDLPGDVRALRTRLIGHRDNALAQLRHEIDQIIKVPSI